LCIDRQIGSTLKLKRVLSNLYIVLPVAFLVVDCVATVVLLSQEPRWPDRAIGRYETALLPGTLFFSVAPAVFFNVVFGFVAGYAISRARRVFGTISRYRRVLIALVLAVILALLAKDIGMPIIRLNQRGCLGGCAVSEVQIYKDGTIVYKGGNCLGVNGNRASKISRMAVLGFVKEIGEMNFVSLKGHYPVGRVVFDVPETAISFRLAGMEKTITYFPTESEVPAGLRDLGSKIAAATDVTSARLWTSPECGETTGP